MEASSFVPEFRFSPKITATSIIYSIFIRANTFRSATNRLTGLFLQIYLFPFKQEENAGFIFQKTIHKQATQSIRNKKGA